MVGLRVQMVPSPAVFCASSVVRAESSNSGSTMLIFGVQLSRVFQL